MGFVFYTGFRQKQEIFYSLASAAAAIELITSCCKEATIVAQSTPKFCFFQQLPSHQQAKKSSPGKMKRRCFADPPHLLYYYPNLGKPLLKMTDCLLVMTALPDQDTARSLAHSLLEEKLAACINLIPPIVSFYEWKGETCEDNECLLLIKTRQSCYGRIEALIHTHHPYELPEIIAMEISHGLPAYLEWIHKSTQE